MVSTHLNVDGESLLQTRSKEVQRLLCVAVEDVKVADTLLAEERARHRTMELPHFAWTTVSTLLPPLTCKKSVDYIPSELNTPTPRSEFSCCWNTGPFSKLSNWVARTALMWSGSAVMNCRDQYLAARAFESNQVKPSDVELEHTLFSYKILELTINVPLSSNQVLNSSPTKAPPLARIKHPKRV